MARTARMNYLSSLISTKSSCSCRFITRRQQKKTKQTNTHFQSGKRLRQSPNLILLRSILSNISAMCKMFSCINGFLQTINAGNMSAGVHAVVACVCFDKRRPAGAPAPTRALHLNHELDAGGFRLSPRETAPPIVPAQAASLCGDELRRRDVRLFILAPGTATLSLRRSS